MTETDTSPIFQDSSDAAGSDKSDLRAEILVNDLPHFEPIADAAYERVLARAREMRPFLAEKWRLRQEAEAQRQARAASGDWTDPEEITFS